MRTAWVIIIISAITDAGITVGTAISAAMLASGSPALPNHAVMLLAFISGGVTGLRTIQQALKNTPAGRAGLDGKKETEL